VPELTSRPPDCVLPGGAATLKFRPGAPAGGLERERRSGGVHFYSKSNKLSAESGAPGREKVRVMDNMGTHAPAAGRGA
jgi:hypothetical protein